MIAIVAHAPGHTNGVLAAAWSALGIDARVVAPAETAALDAGDVALFRLDVTEELDGIEPGLEYGDPLERRGVRVLNEPWALLGAHDKLETARRLAAAGVPHPRTVHVVAPDDEVAVAPPVVVKPRHGSWGRDVVLCRTEAELRACLHDSAGRGWFRAHGALVQQLLDPPRRDIRVLVAGGHVVGAIARERRGAEWRTNASLGARIVPVRPDAHARALALAAVAAVGGDLVGVDLLPAGSGYVVLELNGAVDFDVRYSLPGGDVFAATAASLRLSTDRDVRDLRVRDRDEVVGQHP